MDQQVRNDLQIYSTEDLLAQWGRWGRSGGAKGYISPSLAMMRDNVEMPSPEGWDIHDNTGRVLDEIVARLSGYDQHQAALLYGTYVMGCERKFMARKWGISESNASKLFACAKNYVSGVIGEILDPVKIASSF